MNDQRGCLVTGGSGFLGINLIRHLLSEGWKVVSFDIAEFPFEDVASRINVIQGDIRDRNEVDQAMKGIDVVIHTAAALPLQTEKEIYSTEVSGTRNCLESALENQVLRFIHISSTAVYGVPDHHPLYEDDDVCGVGPYGKAKILAEELCREFREKGICVTILRPKSFVGPERLGVFAMLYEWAYEGRNFPLLGTGKNRYQLLDVEDLCRAISLAAELDESRVNDTFNIGASEFETIAEDFQAVLERAGHGKKIITLPAGPLVLTLKVLEFLGLSPLYQWIYETVAKDSFVSIEKAVNILGYSPKHSNRDALIRNFDWYCLNREKFVGKSGTSHTVPWNQGVLRLAKYFF